MQSTPLKRQAVLAIFGTQAGTKLLNMLNTCCSSQPAIKIAFNALCNEIDPVTDIQTYNVTASATYNTNIPGYTTLIGYVSTAPFPDWTQVSNEVLDNLDVSNALIEVKNITANSPVFFANLVFNKELTVGTYYAMVTDNRGNYSNLLTFTIPNCS